MTKTQHGIVACVIGATTWGFNGVVSQFLLSHYPVEPSWLASIRMCLAGVVPDAHGTADEAGRDTPDAA